MGVALAVRLPPSPGDSVGVALSVRESVALALPVLATVLQAVAVAEVLLPPPGLPLAMVLPVAFAKVGEAVREEAGEAEAAALSVAPPVMVREGKIEAVAFKEALGCVLPEAIAVAVGSPGVRVGAGPEGLAAAVLLEVTLGLPEGELTEAALRKGEKVVVREAWLGVKEAVGDGREEAL